MHRILLPLLLVSPVSSLRAQDVEKEAQKPSREAAAQSSAVKAAEEAQKTVVPGEDEVSYEQVLAQPDDVELNYRYARAQVRRGDVKGASATLERILLVDPDLPRVRLLRGVVLFRLDNMPEAKREFDALMKLKLPEEVRKEVQAYLREIDKRSKRTSLAGRLGVGFEYNDNRNATPSSGKRLFFDTPLQLTGASLRRDDTDVIFLAGVSARRDLGSQRGHELIASLDYYRAEQTLVKTLNLEAVSASAGGVYKSRWGSLTPQGLFDHVRLAQTTFLRNRGASLRWDRRLRRGGSLFLEVRDVYQDYSPTRQLPAAKERTGIQADISAGGDLSLGPRMRLGAAYTHATKHAQMKFYAFERDGARLTHSWLLGKGTFLLSNAGVNHDRYEQPDTTISRKLRRDTTWRAGLTYGAPLSLLRPGLKDLVWTAGYEYYQAVSNIRNYSYTDNKLITMLTYKWELGL